MTKFYCLICYCQDFIVYFFTLTLCWVCWSVVAILCADFWKLYSRDQLVYNLHSLIHLADDAKHYGALDNCSSFKYKSYLGQLKKLVPNAQSSCSQIAKRIFENADIYTCQCNHIVGFSKLHTDGPVNIKLSHYLQFKQYQNKKCFMSNSVRDNCFEIMIKLELLEIF